MKYHGNPEPVTGCERWVRNVEDGKLVFEERQDVALDKKYAQEMRAASAGAPVRPHTQNHRRHVAEIPPVIANQLMRDGIIPAHGGARDQWRCREWPGGRRRLGQDAAGTVSPVGDGRVEVAADGEMLFDRKAEDGVYPEMKRVREIKQQIKQRLASRGSA